MEHSPWNIPCSEGRVALLSVMHLKVGGQDLFLLTAREGQHLFLEKNTKIPRPSSPKKKRTFPSTNIGHTVFELLLC